MADDIRKTIPQLDAGGVVSGSLFESAQPAQTSTGYASVKVTSDDIATYTNATKSYSALNTSAKQIIPAINEAASMGGVVQLTQAEYTALTQAEKMNGSIYKLTDKAIFYCLDEEYHAVKEITSADYALLTSAEKNNGTLYVITDEETTGEDIPVNTLTPDTSINSAINMCFGRTGSDIPVSDTVSTSIADKLDNVPTFDTLTSSDNNKLLGVSVSGSDISVGAVALSSLVKSVFLTSSMTCNYADSSTIGYRSTTSDKVNITSITGYPTGKTILGVAVEYAYYGSVGEYYRVAQLNIVNNETWANSKVGGTVRFGVRVYYLDD